MKPGEVFNLLRSNPDNVFREALRILGLITDNILKEPDNPKYKTLQKSNPSIHNKVLSVNGGKESLILMGFEETTGSYVLNVNAGGVNKILEFKKQLHSWMVSPENTITSSVVSSNNHQEPSASTSRSISVINNEVLPEVKVKRIVLPTYQYKYTNPFLKRVEINFHNAQVYEDPALLRRAKSIIPIDLLEFRAVKRVRWLQKQLKKDAAEDPNVMLQDFMILELAHWFKTSFFSWVDSPPCDYCSAKTEFFQIEQDSSKFLYTNRIELHKCLSCNKITPFPRYNDLYILLETRRGRCGEWANTFCLLCRAMGWDSRFIVEESDHVWVEVYSLAQRRWLHCDPCEDVCDKPLMYEVGWRKNISYVMAYSAEEVQDVTWRYTCNYKEVLSRRKECSEPELIDCLMKLRQERQSKMSVARKKYLTKRVLVELLEFMTERQASSADSVGRVSGSLDWRLSRGEVGRNSSDKSHVWTISEDNVINNEFKLYYSVSKDQYLTHTKDGRMQIKKHWNSGTFHLENVFRKEEHDWKTVYLARNENCDVGKISWKFKILDDFTCIEEIVFHLEYKTFENGRVDVNVSPGEDKVVNSDNFKYSVRLPENCKEVTVVATLLEGKGDVAWQHAQLFRQPLDSNEFPFQVILKLKK